MTASNSLFTAVVKQGIPVKSCPEIDVRKLLGIVILLVGLVERSRPTKLEMELLCDFIRKFYSDYSLEEIRFAFENGLARKYGNDFDPKCYGSLSSEYIGGFIEAYEKWNGNDGSTFSPFQYKFDPNDLRWSTQCYYEEFLEGNVKEFYPSNIYKQLVFDGFIKELPGKQGSRYFPVQVEIKRAFSVAASRGISALYGIAEEQHGIDQAKSPGLIEDRNWQNMNDNNKVVDNQMIASK